MNRILIVDSNLPFLMRIRKALEREGFTIRAISRPRPALKELSQERFDIAVVDLHMDWVNMETFIRDMRTRQRDLPIVLTGQYPEDPDQVPVLEAQGYLNKPYLARDLIPVLKQAFNKGFKPPPVTDQNLFVGDFGEVPSFDVLLDMARNQANHISEPAIDDDATIGELLSSLYDEDVESEILKQVEGMRGGTGNLENDRPALLIPDDEYSIDAQSIEILDERALAEALEEAGAQSASDIFEAAYGDELEIDVDDDFISTPPPDSLPEDTSELPTTSDVPDKEPVTRALKLANNADAMQRFLQRVQQVNEVSGRDIEIKPLPSWLVPISDDEREYREALLEAIHLTPDATDLPEDFEAPPHSAQTQPITVPEIDLILENETPQQPMQPVDVADVMAEMDYDLDITNVPLPETAALEPQAEQPPMEAGKTVTELLEEDLEEELVPMNVEEITQAMGVMDLDEADFDDYESEATDEFEVDEEHPAFQVEPSSTDEVAVDELLNEIDEDVNVVARATLQLMDMALESAARAILLSHDGQLLARSGELPDGTWSDIEAAIQNAWMKDGGHTRLTYAEVRGLNSILLYSLETFNNFRLSMIFPADTHVSAIRKQADKLREALEDTPEITAESTYEAEPIIDIEDDEAEAVDETEFEESTAAITLPSRPTAMKADGLAKPIPNPIPERKAGTYTSYGVTWLLGAEDVKFNKPIANALSTWVYRVAAENDWDVHGLEIGKEWVNLNIHIPAQELINDVIFEIMDDTNDRLLNALGRDPEFTSYLWSDGYSITTPGRLYEHEEITTFAEYFRNELLRN